MYAQQYGNIFISGNNGHLNPRSLEVYIPPLPPFRVCLSFCITCHRSVVAVAFALAITAAVAFSSCIAPLVSAGFDAGPAAGGEQSRQAQKPVPLATVAVTVTLLLDFSFRPRWTYNARTVSVFTLILQRSVHFRRERCHVTPCDTLTVFVPDKIVRELLDNEEHTRNKGGPEGKAWGCFLCFARFNRQKGVMFELL